MGPLIKNAQVLVFDDASALEDFLLGKWTEMAGEAVARRGFFAAALSGGGTPVGFYRKLARLSGKYGPVWKKTHIFMVDERMVPQDSKDSNFGMINETLLSGSPVPRENIHPIRTDELPEICAERYAFELSGFFRLQKGEAPVFDLVLLGLGEDGHTASLFPGAGALKEKERLAAAVHDEQRHDRVTLTYPVLNSARNVIFLVTGEKKAAVLERVIEKNDPALPASAVNPENGMLLFLADAVAARRLPPGRCRKMQM